MFIFFLICLFFQYNNRQNKINSRSQMLHRSIYRIIKNASSIKQSLKILQLTVPTTKASIKKQYLILAKKYHPDSADSISQNQQIKPKHKQNKKQENSQFQQKFVNINRAYQYLRDLTQQQINSNKQKISQDMKSDKTGGQTYEQRKQKMSAQQMKRQQSYDYFNNGRKYNPQNAQNYNVNMNDYMERQRKPLYKTVPQLFVGFLLLAFVLGDWTYRVAKRKYNKSNDKTKQQNKQKQEMRLPNAFKSMSHNTVFSKNSKAQMIQ